VSNERDGAFFSEVFSADIEYYQRKAYGEFTTDIQINKHSDTDILSDETNSTDSVDYPDSTKTIWHILKKHYGNMSSVYVTMYLIYYIGISYAEAGKILKCSRNNLNRSVMRAVKYIKAHIRQKKNGKCRAEGVSKCKGI
jgi:RNase P/RNase MRP subunit POP5